MTKYQDLTPALPRMAHGNRDAIDELARRTPRRKRLRRLRFLRWPFGRTARIVAGGTRRPWR